MPQDGLDESQIRRLRSRKRVGEPGQEPTESDKWVAMYRIIFPDDDDVPSPRELYQPSFADDG